MREQCCLAERSLAAPNHYFSGNPAQAFEEKLVAAERKRNERRTRFDQLEPKMARERIGEIGCADLRDGRTPGGDHQRWGAGRAVAERHPKAGVSMRHVANATPKREIDRAGGAFVPQHRDDLTRRTIAKKLAQCLLVPGDAVAFDQR